VRKCGDSAGRSLHRWSDTVADQGAEDAGEATGERLKLFSGHSDVPRDEAVEAVADAYASKPQTATGFAVLLLPASG
jgi:hypothetical protein